jgi:TonB family protein
MQRHIVVTLLAFVLVFTSSACPSFAQEQSATARRIVNRVAPEYPRTARDMNLGGIVRVEAVVATNGSVKSVEIRGGHPLLAVAAVGAVSKWKWEPATHETREPVELKFNPH